MPFAFVASTTRQGPNPEPFVDRTFRGGTTSATDFQLSVLMRRHPDYLSLKEQFMEKWQKPEPARGVSILRIFKVQVRSFWWLTGIKGVRGGGGGHMPYFPAVISRPRCNAGTE